MVQCVNITFLKLLTFTGLPTLKYIAEAYLGRVWRGFLVFIDISKFPTPADRKTYTEQRTES